MMYFYHRTLKMIDFLPQDKSNFLQVHVCFTIFTKYFFGARVYEKLSNFLVFAI